MLALFIFGMIAAAEPMRVAVLHFDNNTGDAAYDVLNKGMADMLITDLSATNGLEIVERGKLDQILQELALQQTKAFDPTTAQRVGKLAGARYAVTGAIAAVDPELRLDVRMIEVASARIVVAAKVSGNKLDLFHLEEELVGRFVAGLSLPMSAPKSGAGSVDRLLAYSHAIDAADRGDLTLASTRMGAVVKQAPTFTMAQQRYLEILRRLRERRENIYSGEERTLVDHIEAALKQPFAPADRRSAIARLAHRELLSRLLSTKLGALTERLRGPCAELGRGAQENDLAIPRSKQAAALPLMKALFANQRAYFDEVTQVPRVRFRAHDQSPYALEIGEEQTTVHFRQGVAAADLELAQSLGVAKKQETLIARCHTALADLARFAAFGNMRDVVIARRNGSSEEEYVVFPSILQLEPAFADEVIAMLDGGARHAKEADAIALLDVAAEALLSVGRKAEAIERWQHILASFPKAPSYDKTEARVRDVIQAGAQEDALRQRVSRCDASLNREVTRMRDERLGFDVTVPMLDYLVKSVWQRGGDDDVWALYQGAVRAQCAAVMTPLREASEALAVRQNRCKLYARLRTLEDSRAVRRSPLCEDVCGP
jgi:TolB-like protein